MIQKELLLILAAVLLVCSVADLAGAGGVDVNDDGVVDTADLEFVDRHIGTTGEHAADVNDDNIVNITDLVLVKNAIGTTSALTGMVLIPAGSFRMGSNDPEGFSDEQPVHTVYVDAFYMDKYEVTVGQYKQFVRATGHRDLSDWVSTYSLTDRHPVVGVSWYDAMAYAAWAGKRLPTEAEWEKAARGGLAGQKYPWGNTIDSRKANYNRNIGKTTSVGSYSPNAYGLYDMAGNVWEWCLDAYDANFYRNPVHRNPIAGAASISDVINNYTNVKSSRVLRGGSWNDTARNVRVANRYGNTPALTFNDLGFRCARTVTP